MTDSELDLELVYTPFDVPRCRNIYTIDQWCKRPRGHTGEHASGFGLYRARWSE